VYGAADAPAFETGEELGVAWHGAESLHNADLSVRSHRRAVLNAEQQFAHRCANSDPALFFGPFHAQFNGVVCRLAPDVYCGTDSDVQFRPVRVR